MERALPNCFNSFAKSTRRETVETVATDHPIPTPQLKLDVNEKPLLLQPCSFTLNEGAALYFT